MFEPCYLDCVADAHRLTFIALGSIAIVAAVYLAAGARLVHRVRRTPLIERGKWWFGVPYWVLTAALWIFSAGSLLAGYAAVSSLVVVL